MKFLLNKKKKIKRKRKKNEILKIVEEEKKKNEKQEIDEEIEEEFEEETTNENLFFGNYQKEKCLKFKKWIEIENLETIEEIINSKKCYLELPFLEFDKVI